MSQITHHIPEPIMLSYASGGLPNPIALVVATHVSLCERCRVLLGAHEVVGGALLDAQTSQPVPDSVRDSVLACLDDSSSWEPAPSPERSGPYPGPLMQALGGQAPRWRRVGNGVRQSILSEGREGSVRLLSIPPGQAVPDHGHHGLELTLVLQGAFRDDTGRYAVGDVEVADETLDHTPVAEPGNECICLAASEAPLKFNTLIPRILQPLFRI